jgi:predicted Rossmann fold nucleotide-binding protein DprA/Smf involved in DNA uptake
VTALHALRALGETSAAHLAACTGISLEEVYLTLIEAQAAGTVSLRQRFRFGRKPAFTWVAL